MRAMFVSHESQVLDSNRNLALARTIVAQSDIHERKSCLKVVTHDTAYESSRAEHVVQFENVLLDRKHRLHKDEYQECTPASRIHGTT